MSRESIYYDFFDLIDNLWTGFLRCINLCMVLDPPINYETGCEVYEVSPHCMT
jgi:hypothetical protein